MTTAKRGKRSQGGIDKADLDGQLIQFTVVRFEPTVTTRYGVTQVAHVNLTVLSGPQAGRRVYRWRVMGAIARQMGGLARGRMHAARVRSHTSKKGVTWYGIDLNVDATDRRLADEIADFATHLDDLEAEL